MWNKNKSMLLLLALFIGTGGVLFMANKYCNLQGGDKIKDTYTDINTGFDGVDADVSALDGRVDTIITTPAEGVTAQEIIDARKGEATLRNKIDGIDAQMADVATQINSLNDETLKKIKQVTQNPESYRGAVVTIMDDDCKSEFLTVWQSVLNDTGARITAAAITGRVGTVGYMTKTELLALQNAGNEIVSHTNESIETSAITPEQAEISYSTSRQWLIDNGFFGYDTLVYPGGMHTEQTAIKAIARKYYKHAVATQISGTYNLTPVDSWRINRSNGDENTLATLCAQADAAKLANGWLIIMTHSHVLGSVGSQKMRDFITYIQAQGIPIMTFGEAAKLKGNVIAIGDYPDYNSIFVSADGNVKNNEISGTWIPTLSGVTTAGSHTYSGRSGKYTRRGKFITAGFYIRVESGNIDAAMAGALKIEGLPFAVASGNERPVLQIEYNVLNLGTNFYGIVGEPADNSIYLYKYGSGVPFQALLASTIPAATVVVLRGEFTYRMA